MLLPFFNFHFHPLQSTVMMLLLYSINVTLGRISLLQTRVSENSEPAWPVEGVASLELDTDVIGYWFDCNAGELTSKTRLTWERVGHDRNPFDVARLSMGRSRMIVGGGQLVQENLGYYRCWHRDTGESTVLLLTSESPAIVSTKETVVAMINTTVALSVHISTFLGPQPNNNLHITWFLPNGQALSQNDTSIEYHSTGSNLVLPNVTAHSIGEYSCTVQESASPTTRSTSIHLRLFIPAAIIEQPLPVAVVEGQNATLTCTATGSPAPNITWKRTGSPPLIITPGHRILIQNSISSNREGEESVSSRLVLVEARSEDTGGYYCAVHNTLSDMQHTVISHLVNVSVTVESVGPPVARVTYNSASSSTHSVVLFSGEQSKPVFRCSAYGRPSPSISWEISHSHSTPGSIHYTYELTQSQLSLVWEEPAEPSDSGLYQCVASNPWGESRASVHLTVIHRPVIDSIIPAKGIKLLPAKKNSRTTFEVPKNFVGTLLTCSGYGWPVPRIQWTPLDELVQCELISETRTYSDGVVKAELIVNNPFNQSCAVRVQCKVVLADGGLVVGREVENVSISVDLRQGPDTHQTSATKFQLSLTALSSLECSLWTNKDKSRIKTELGQALSRSVTTSLEHTTSDDCINISSLTCDGDRVLSVGGTLQDCSAIGPSDSTLYSFLLWKNRGPLVSLNGTLLQVDPLFPLCLTGSECGLSQSSEDTCSSSTDITIGLYVVSGAILLCAMVLIAVILCKCRQHSCWETNTRINVQDKNPNDYTR